MPYKRTRPLQHAINTHNTEDINNLPESRTESATDDAPIYKVVMNTIVQLKKNGNDGPPPRIFKESRTSTRINTSLLDATGKIVARNLLNIFRVDLC